MSDARSQILRSVRGALEDRPAPAPDARPVCAEPPADSVARFVERAGECGADVSLAGADVGAAVARACVRHGVTSLACPPDIPEPWVPQGVARVDTGGRPAALDAVDGVLSGCALAIADTGTIVLDGGRAQGARALTLVPDLHICVVGRGQVVTGVVEAMPRVAAAIRDRRAPVTFITGPSATSDIELSRIEGVHGPRRLVVLIAD